MSKPTWICFAGLLLLLVVWGILAAIGASRGLRAPATLSSLPMSNNAFAQQVAAGETTLQSGKTKILFLALARDLSPPLTRMRTDLDDCLARWPRSHLMILENGSVDATRAYLSGWVAVNSSVTLLECCGDGPCDCSGLSDETTRSGTGFNRIARMAALRERLRAEAHKAHGDADYVAVVDIDLPQIPVRQGIQAMIARSGEWDVVFANTLKPLNGSLGLKTRQYDTQAFVPVSALGLKPSRLSKRETIFKELGENLNNWGFRFLHRGHEPTELIPVGSAFNGFALYKAAAYWDNAVTYGTGSSICEHISLHMSMHEAGHGRLMLGMPLRMNKWG